MVTFGLMGRWLVANSGAVERMPDEDDDDPWGGWGPRW